MLVEIPLTQGKVALIDAADLAVVSKYRWHTKRSATSFYAVANTKINRWGGKHKIYMHRLILNLSNGSECDHRDRDGLNNTRANLRECTRSENMGNSASHSDSSSQYKGVSWTTTNDKWRVQIKKDGKYRHIGYFIEEEAAAIAYDRAATKLHGNFARLNFP